MRGRRGSEKRTDDAWDLHTLVECPGGDKPVLAGEGVVGVVQAREGGNCACKR